MRNFRFLSLFILLFFPLSLAAAQDIPLSLLESDRKSCRASCDQSFSGKQCTKLCDCTVTAFKRQINFDLYLQIVSEISQNKLSKDNSRLMDAIAVECSSSISDARPLHVELRTEAGFK